MWKRSRQCNYPCSSNNNWLQYFKERYPKNRDQGIYATCWANTSMSLAEFYLISHGMADTATDLSELHLNYWSYAEGTASQPAGDTGDTVNYTVNGSSDNILNNGGSLELANQTLMRQRGFAVESVAPYTMAREIAEGGKLNSATERKDDVYLVSSNQINLKGNSDLVKEAIIANGAAGISLYASRYFYNSETNAYCCLNHMPSEANHAVTLVGWDDDYPMENFKTIDGKIPSSNGAWLVRNSYSTEVEASFESYFWLSYEDTSITNAWVYTVSRTFPYDNHYYYNSTIHNSAYYRGRRYANVYTVNGTAGTQKESLEAVSFEVAASGATPGKYTVEIYRNLTGEAPNSGELIKDAVTTGSIAFKGQYTVKLASPVLLEKGKKFSIVVYFDDPDFAVKQERDMVEYGGVTVRVASKEGQSYYSKNGSTWFDTGEEGNLVISAMTMNVADDEPTEEERLTAFVDRMYKCCLERDADEEGRAYWVDQLKKGRQDGAGIAEQFFFSKEMVSRDLPDKDFVTLLYNALMGREPESEGLQYWTNSLNTGEFTRYEVLAGFVRSDEYDGICRSYHITRGTVDASAKAPVERFVTRFYKLALGRDPEQGGLYYWVFGLIDQRYSGAGIANEFFFSQEMLEKNLSDEQYVDRLYRVMMDRPAEDSGMAYWLDALSNGMTRERVLGEFVDSPEFTGICREYGITRGSLSYID